jgi:peroxiredoxin
MFLPILVLVIPWLLAALGCWLGWQLVQQNGRILLRLDSLEQRFLPLRSTAQAAPAAPAPTPPAQLPPGAPAPAFELPDLAGHRRALSEWQGQRVLLLFFNPNCGYCTQMVPDLAALPFEGTEGHPVPLVLTTGGVEANRAWIEEHQVRCPVLLQERGEVAAAYGAGGTPMGYLLDEQGRIASSLAVGAIALLQLANLEANQEQPDTQPERIPTETNGHANGPVHRSLEKSRIDRQGLPAGTPAPRFQLPTLDGSELSLDRYRGQTVLLVFSDPHCGPCDQLAPQLERLHRHRADLQVVMISRGDPEENCAKAAQHGLTFPVALQRKWEISKLYAMFATPIAYLIDAEGVIAANIAVGEGQILALASSVPVYAAA